MSEFNIIDVTYNSTRGRLAKRYSAILGKSQLRTWALEEFTRGWSEDERDILRSHLNNLRTHPTKGANLTVVDADLIRSFLFAPVPKYVPGKSMTKDQLSRLKNTDVGVALMVNVPVLCTGIHVHDDIMPDLQERGLIGDNPPKYARAGAHGPTFGTLLAKVVRKNWKDGKFAGPAVVKTALVCNNCLELFCGEVIDGLRGTENIPKSWARQQLNAIQKLQDKHSRASNQASGQMPRKDTRKDKKGPSRSVEDVTKTDEPLETKRDELMKLTVVQIREKLKEFGAPTSGRKSDLVDLLLNLS